MSGGLELWGGIECTVNRVGDHYLDQLELTGHEHRSGDLDLIASLGIRTLRYPVLWERVAPDGVFAPGCWDWCDERLEGLRALGVTPVFGLMHHGSGPRNTDMLDPQFPSKLAGYARACAERYPWMTWVTPVNEPLSTARFSGLYGHWYPHSRDDRAFVRMLLHECFAVREAMRAIHEVNPAVRLMQTEDLGHTHSTARLKYQANFENNRRWLTFDLLCGKVTRDHPMYRYLTKFNASPRELRSLVEDPCPPDLLGIDHYVTSERYLDERVERFPLGSRGGNKRHAYADVEVVRARPDLRHGVRSLLCETWSRYHIPMVVAEAYLSCADPNEQLRWLNEIWTGAKLARDEGCDVRAVTAWALLGTNGWDELATRAGWYDAGAFDVRDGTPRETPLAEMIRSLALTGSYENEALDQRGWWEWSPDDVLDLTDEAPDTYSDRSASV